MNISAIIGLRNEATYIARKLKHLLDNEIDVIIVDNESTDDTVAICLDQGIPRNKIYQIPYNGYFSLKEQLILKEEIRKKIDAEWIIHTDADEIIKEPNNKLSLKEAIINVDNQGFNAINCDEFVFIPENKFVDYSATDYTQTMKYYYFYAPRPIRLIRIFKNDLKSSNIKSGGHFIENSELALYSESFQLLHYIGLNYNSIIEKYKNRIFAPDELNAKWHKSRIFEWDQLKLPNLSQLKFLNDNQFDKSDPHGEHFWYWK